MTTPKTTFAGLVLIAVLCAGFTLGLTAPAWAGFHDIRFTKKGVAAHKRGDYATALSELRPLAKQGNAKAQDYLGLMYYNGHGVPQDYAKAVKWWRKAADHFYANAQYNLGTMYYHGRGVPQDYAKALQLYRIAAVQGHAQAQHNLAIMYKNGEGVTQDYVQAYVWLSIGAPLARNGLSKRFREKFLIIMRDDLAKRMTPAQISEAQKLVRIMTTGHP